jgi:allophanate hydrolase
VRLRLNKDNKMKLSISWLRRGYISGRISPRHVVDIIIKRAKAAREKNIWITEPNMKFIKPYLENLKKMSVEKYPLWGIPFAIKDNIDLEGIATTAGCPSYSYMPKESAQTVKKLIACGAIPVGKTNMDQFATGLVGTRSAYGEVHNALNSKYISGGSSSGSAVCVALGQAAFSLGTDTAGSGRVPAMLNGVYGYKSGVGKWSNDGVVPACKSLDCINVFANNIDDCITIDNIARKTIKSEPLFPQYFCLPKNELEFFGDFADDYRRLWENFKKIIARRAPEVKYINNEVFLETAKILYDGAYIAERWSALGDFISKNGRNILPVTKKILEIGKNKTAAQLFDDLHKLESYKKEVKELLKNGVFILPTVGGTFTREQARNKPIETNDKLGLYTNHCNLLDLAAFAVPFNKTKRGFPFGITIFSLSEQENYLEPSARLIEKAAKESSAFEDIIFSVHGLHMRAMPLNRRLKELGAKFIKRTTTAKEYKLYALNTKPIKPGLVKDAQGREIETELWSFPCAKFAEFLSKTQSPMAFGKIKLSDGNEVLGFLCQPYAIENAREITSYGGWKNFYKRENKKRRAIK